MQNYVTEQKQEIVHLWDHVFGRNETDAEYVSIHLHVRVLWTMLDKFTNIYIYMRMWIVVLCFYLIIILFLLSRLICIYEMYVTLSYFPFEKEIVSVEVYVYGDGSCVGVVWKG